MILHTKFAQDVRRISFDIGLKVERSRSGARFEGCCCRDGMYLFYLGSSKFYSFMYVHLTSMKGLDLDFVLNLYVGVGMGNFELLLLEACTY